MLVTHFKRGLFYFIAKKKPIIHDLTEIDQCNIHSPSLKTQNENVTDVIINRVYSRWEIWAGLLLTKERKVFKKMVMAW